MNWHIWRLSGMKRVIWGLLLILGICMVPLPARTDNTPGVILDGQELYFDVEPVIVDGRVMVPLSKIMEYLGLGIGWNGETRSISFYYNNVCTVDNPEAWVNGNKMILDVPPMIMNGRILVPLRFIAQALHCSINYDSDSNTVYMQTLGSANNDKLDSSVWIYYVDNKTICKQRPDGSQKSTIYEAAEQVGCMDIYEDYLYFCSYEGNWKVYKIALTGGIPEYIADVPESIQSYGMGVISYSTPFRVCDGNIFYSFNQELIKCDLANGDISTLAEFGEHIQISNGWIYYIDIQGEIYRMRYDGSNVTKVGGKSASKILVDGNYIYYRDYDGFLFRTSLDGQQTVLTSGSSVEDFKISDQYLIYWNKSSDTSEIWRIDKEHLDRKDKVLSNSVASNIAFCTVKNGWIYYLDLMSNLSLYAVKEDGTGKTKITNHEVYDVIVH